MTKYDITVLPRRGGYPQTMFFYERGKSEAVFKFTKQSRDHNWIGHGFYAMSRKEVERWVEAGAPAMPGRNATKKRPPEEHLEDAEAKLAEAKEKGLKKVYMTPAQLRSLVALAKLGAGDV